MTHSYSSLFNLHCTGLRFFTACGPWGRPDIALFLFTTASLEDQPIAVFNHRKMKRDFTCTDDIVEGVFRVIHKLPEPDPAWNGENPDSATGCRPYRLYNIGNNQPVDLMRYIEALEECLCKKSEKKFLPMQKGDVPATCADVDDLVTDVGFKPDTPIETGIKNFVDWYQEFLKI
jgi:UDP-glucuronate 4-epimerase